MIDLYGMASPNVYKIAIGLEELALPYRLNYVDVFAEQQFATAFLAVSPTAKVPAIVDSTSANGSSLTLCESGAILIYLAEKTGRLLPIEQPERSMVLQWLMVQMGSLGPMSGQYLHFRFFAQDNRYGLVRYEAQVKNLFTLLDRRLSEAPFLGGASYSIADIASFPWIQRGIEVFPWLKADGLSSLREAHPDLARWYDTVAGRPGVNAAMTRMAPLAEQTAASAAAATPAAMDRFLARNSFLAKNSAP